MVDIDIARVNIRTDRITPLGGESGFTGLGGAGAPTFSPSGGEIAFTNLDSKDGKPTGVYIMSASGTNARRVVPLTILGHELEDEYPNWSPNGKQLVLTHATLDTYNYGNLFTVSVNGGLLKQATSIPNYAIQPNWVQP